jgi:hypothetical protein
MAINRLIQGSLQSGLPKFDTVWDGRSAVGSMEPITSITLTGTQSTIVFNNIPSTYTHLQIRGFGRTTRASVNSDVIRIRFNSDAASNYSVHSLLGEGGGVVPESFANTSQTYMQTYIIAGDGAGTSTFGTFITDILDYTSTNKNKTIKQLAGIDNNGNGVISLFSGLWYKTPEAVNTITMTAIGNFVANSSFSLYGIK